MKKLLLLFPIITLLAVGCNSSQSTTEQTPVKTPVIQNANPQPSPTPAASSSNKTVTPLACPRPSDNNGKQYETTTGTFVKIYTDQSGGDYIIIKPANAASNATVVVTKPVIQQLQSVSAGTNITLFSYSNNSMSGSQPPYSCVEILN